MSDPWPTWYLDEESRETAIQVLDGLNIPHEVETVYRVDVVADGDRPDHSDPEESPPDGRGLPDDGTKTFEIARRLGNHEREWCNGDDLEASGDEWTLSLLRDRGVVERRENTRNGCSYEYRLRPSYRRELDLIASEIAEEINE